MTNVNIYPYVYRCEHKVTKQFYIGFRGVPKLPPEQDLPKYRTSSKIVKPDFDNYTWEILAVFWEAADAYDYEQVAIAEGFQDPLNLNMYYFHHSNRQ